MFYLNEFLERVGIKPNETKLLRHNPRDFTYWIGRELDKFGCYASFQKKRLRHTPNLIWPVTLYLVQTLWTDQLRQFIWELQGSWIVGSGMEEGYQAFTMKI